MLNNIIYNLKKKICELEIKLNNIIQPFFIGRYYNVGDAAVSDNTKYICIKAHTSSPEIFIGNPEYWIADFGIIINSKKIVKKSKNNVNE